MRRRKRRSRPLWFPPLGSPFTVGDDTTVFGGVTFALVVDATGAITFTEIPLTFDFGQEALLADSLNAQTIPSLSDLQSSAWRLRRVVGKIFAAYHIDDSGLNDPRQGAYPAVAFAAGLMVRKVNEFSTAQTNVDIWNRDDYDDPWLWRRSWILGQDARFNKESNPNSLALNVATGIPGTGVTAPVGTDQFAAFARFPNTTAHYGSVQDGGHIDQQTNRIIGPEDRLFMHFAVKGLPIQPDDNVVQGSKVFGMFDLRYLGFLARATNRRNASR